MRVHTSAALPYLLKTNGRVISITSGAAQVRIPTSSYVPRRPSGMPHPLDADHHSDYCTSKFALGRLSEFISIGARPACFAPRLAPSTEPASHAQSTPRSHRSFSTRA
jgi:NAD(P)-dependent dehydrogenase (short-subunit alcohol dehydrogenase family)